MMDAANRTLYGPESIVQWLNDMATHPQSVYKETADLIENLQAQLQHAHAANGFKDSENPMIQALTEEVERLRNALGHIAQTFRGGASLVAQEALYRDGVESDAT